MTKVDDSLAGSSLDEETPTSRRNIRFDRDHPHYKWIALSNTTLGMLIATINSSIVLISLPAIFRGIGLNPLAPGNVSYLLWMIMGFLLVTAVLVVSLGRLGDMYGRVKIYNLGFVVFTAGVDRAVARSVPRGERARCGSSSGGSCRPSAARCCSPTRPRSSPTRSRPSSAVSRSASTRSPRSPGRSSAWCSVACSPSGTGASVFWVSVPIGVLGTVWAYRSLHDTR